MISRDPAHAVRRATSGVDRCREVLGPKPGKNSYRKASDVKQVHAILKDMTNDELTQIPILDAGSRLEQDGTYLDLNDADRQEFTAAFGMEAGPDSLIVPKTEVDYQLWNRLRGVTDPARTGGVSGT